MVAHQRTCTTYDGLNRLVISSDGTRYDSFYNTSWQLIEQRKAQDVDPNWSIIWDLRYIDAPLAWWKDANVDGDYADAGDYIQYYTNDANMNVTALIEADDGSVFERYEYDPYGKPTVLDDDWSADGDGNPDSWSHFLFQGTYWRQQDGTYLVRNRVYHPTLGRWVQRDPIGYADGQNLYAAYHVMHGAADPSGQYGIVWLQARVVAKSFINGIPRVGKIGTRPGLPVNEALAGVLGLPPVAPPQLNTPDGRLVWLASVAKLTGPFRQNPMTDRKQDDARLYTTATISWCCYTGEVENVKISNTDMQGGSELFGLDGTINMSHITEEKKG